MKSIRILVQSHRYADFGFTANIFAFFPMLLDFGYNIAKLVDILGHSSINTTRIYIMVPASNIAARSSVWGLWYRKHHIIRICRHTQCAKSVHGFGTL